MVVYVVVAWILGSVPLAVLVGRSMRHGLASVDERTRDWSGAAGAPSDAAARTGSHDRSLVA